MASKATTGPSVSSPGSHHAVDLKKHGSIERMWGREQRSPSVLRSRVRKAESDPHCGRLDLGCEATCMSSSSFVWCVRS